MQFSNPLHRLKNAFTLTNHNHQSQSQLTPIDHTDVLTLLSSERRRHTIEYLADQPPTETVPVSDIVNAVAAKENDCTISELSSEQRKRVKISLYQQHLPTLEGFVVKHDLVWQKVIPTETPARIWRAYCDFCETLDG